MAFNHQPSLGTQVYFHMLKVLKKRKLNSDSPGRKMHRFSKQVSLRCLMGIWLKQENLLSRRTALGFHSADGPEYSELSLWVTRLRGWAHACFFWLYGGTHCCPSSRSSSLMKILHSNWHYKVIIVVNMCFKNYRFLMASWQTPCMFLVSPISVTFRVCSHMYASHDFATFRPW